MSLTGTRLLVGHRRRSLISQQRSTTSLRIMTPAPEGDLQLQNRRHRLSARFVSGSKADGKARSYARSYREASPKPRYSLLGSRKRASRLSVCRIPLNRFDDSSDGGPSQPRLGDASQSSFKFPDKSAAQSVRFRCPTRGIRGILPTHHFVGGKQRVLIAIQTRLSLLEEDSRRFTQEVEFTCKPIRESAPNFAEYVGDFVNLRILDAHRIQDRF